MARTVEDVSILFDAIAGSDCTNGLTGKIRDIRVGVPYRYFFENIHPAVESCVTSGLTLLEDLGARLVEVDIPSALEQRRIFEEIVGPEAHVYHEEFLRTQGDLYGSDVRTRIEAGRDRQSTDYVKAKRSQWLMQQECEKVFEIADVIVTPTLPIPPPRIDRIYEPWDGGSETAIASLTRFTRPFNILGLGTVSIPCGFTTDGLPIGMQIAGRTFDEKTVLRVAHAYEQHAKWFLYTPSVAGNSKGLSG
jgi:aspartyl-tRNA(Asn)/glutamyl-tRNA(Gln) amidotransferase subunit A